MKDFIIAIVSGGCSALATYCLPLVFNYKLKPTIKLIKIEGNDMLSGIGLKLHFNIKNNNKKEKLVVYKLYARNKLYEFNVTDYMNGYRDSIIEIPCNKDVEIVINFNLNSFFNSPDAGEGTYNATAVLLSSNIFLNSNQIDIMYKLSKNDKAIIKNNS